MHMPRHSRCLFLSCAAVMLNGSAGFAQTTPIDFNRQIRPILSDNCFVCHGPDDQVRKAKLRLDSFAGATAKLRREGQAVVPGRPDESEILRRILSDDPTEKMPPAKTKKHVTREQAELIKQWIREGAKYAEHWAFVAPKRSSLPAVSDAKWPRNAIDRFVLARLEKEGMKPSPEADRATLIRRLSHDLTGLPPTPAEVDAFLNDKRPDAYERLVDRLFASPHYGERVAVDWLDAARFADTHGYHIDAGRDMTRWRDYVIDAFQTNLPFDQFTVEQLAGDLLPGATVKQKVASGFNRNHMINFEGGAIPEEYLNNYIVDRVSTTSTVWLGLTVACAQCHDHKYDPISQREFYQLYAFFHNVPENGLDGAKGNASPTLKAPTPEQEKRLAVIEREMKEIDAKLAAGEPKKEPSSDAAEFKKEKARLLAAKAELEKQVPSTMVMQELPNPRETFVLLRGEYNKRGDKVKAATPAFLPALPTLPKDSVPNRLALARWLVDRQHPLTSRVIVNRYWQMIFGTGLVKTVEDFGSQGEAPSHAELLDWLAVEFMEPTREGSAALQPWSVRDLLRLIVTSATYRQASVIRKDDLAKDKDNRLLARAPRYRLQAEFIRDQALALSGLLNREVGGGSVSPYQPAGLWQELASRNDSKNWSAQVFEQSHGKNLYRRTMYTFWKRASPPPQLMTFDAPDRETCTVRRSRTNTPLQALILMNDPTYVESARKFAERIIAAAATTEERIAFAFRIAAARSPNPREADILRGAYERQLARYRAGPKAAEALLATGESPRNGTMQVAELAAWTMVASAILNLDEVLTKN